MNPQDELLFFAEPSIEPLLPGEFSTLYLLRRDAKNCLEARILWPGAMCVMAGIDLLGKFLAGSDAVHESGGRFSAFSENYLHLAPSDATALYQWRNALLHSFGWVSVTRMQSFHFQLRNEGNGVPIVAPLSAGVVKVDLASLHNGFEAAVCEYRAHLQGSQDLQGKFEQIFQQYGKCSIG